MDSRPDRASLARSGYLPARHDLHDDRRADRFGRAWPRRAARHRAVARCGPAPPVSAGSAGRTPATSTSGSPTTTGIPRPVSSASTASCRRPTDPRAVAALCRRASGRSCSAAAARCSPGRWRARGTRSVGRPRLRRRPPRLLRRRDVADRRGRRHADRRRARRRSGPWVDRVAPVPVEPARGDRDPRLPRPEELDDLGDQLPTSRAAGLLTPTPTRSARDGRRRSGPPRSTTSSGRPSRSGSTSTSTSSTSWSSRRPTTSSPVVSTGTSWSTSSGRRPRHRTSSAGPCPATTPRRTRPAPTAEPSSRRSSVCSGSPVRLAPAPVVAPRLAPGTAARPARGTAPRTG